MGGIKLAATDGAAEIGFHRALGRASIFTRHQGRDLRIFFQRQDGLAVGTEVLGHRAGGADHATATGIVGHRDLGLLLADEILQRGRAALVGTGAHDRLGRRLRRGWSGPKRTSALAARWNTKSWPATAAVKRVWSSRSPSTRPKLGCCCACSKNRRWPVEKLS